MNGERMEPNQQTQKSKKTNQSYEPKNARKCVCNSTVNKEGQEGKKRGALTLVRGMVIDIIIDVNMLI